MTHILVIGGGISGMAAATALVAEPDTTVEVWEADDRLGGKIATSRFAGLDHIDEAADAYLTRVPHAVDFARRVGIGDIAAPTGVGAAVWHNGLHDIPGGILLGVPAAVTPFVTTSLLSTRGKLRAALEPFLPRTRPDDCLGALVRARFGDEVHERLVDALIGSIYATDTDRSSLAAIPQLATIAAANRSLLLGARGARRGSGRAVDDSPIFGAPATGMASLIAGAAKLVAEAGGTIRTGAAVTTIEADGTRWRVDDRVFDGVVVAAPARAAARLLSGVAPEAAGILDEFEHADVIMVRLLIPDWPERLHGKSGYLVPKPDQEMVTAASFASQKWARWQPPHGGQILRVSLGRDGLPVAHLDDDAVLAHTLRETGRHLDLDLAPTEVSITRWLGAFPQYRPHHHDRVAHIEATLPPTIALAGASYRGIGLPACIADGERAAAKFMQSTRTADTSMT